MSDEMVWDEDRDGNPIEPEDDGYEYDAPIDTVQQTAEIEKVRAEMSEPSPNEGLPADLVKFPVLDWTAGFKTDFSQVDWLPGRFMERGQQVALVGDGKVGKSLFALDWAIRATAGRNFLGDGAHDPIRVLYLDKENSTRDVITRARALGATPEDLANLHYAQFPAFAGSLDQSKAASAELGRLVNHYRPTVVVLDTVSRFIGGKENDSDTWLQLYSLIHEPMKRNGIACLRLDHFGKDSERGSRGSSAKNQDVDHVWELKRVRVGTTMDATSENIVTEIEMNRTHTRTGLGKDKIAITRRGIRSADGTWYDGRTKHTLSDGAAVRDTEALIEGLADRIEALPGYRNMISPARDGIRTLIRTTDIKVSNDAMGSVVAELRKRKSTQ